MSDAGAGEAHQVFSDEMVSTIQQALGIFVLSIQALLAPLNAGQDDLAAHVEALLTWQARLLGQLAGLGQEIGCQRLHRLFQLSIRCKVASGHLSFYLAALLIYLQASPYADLWPKQ